MNNLPPALQVIVNKRQCKRELNHTDLSLSSPLYDTQIQTVKAVSPEDFDYIRGVLCSMFGVGVRKRFPNKSDINNKLKNPLKLCTYHTLHAVDISLLDDTTIDHDVDVDKFASESSNFLRWQWNPVTRICITTIRYVPLVASSSSDAFISFLSRFKIDWTIWTKEIDGLWVNANLWCNDDEKEYQITQIDAANKIITLLELNDEGEAVQNCAH